MSIGTRISQAVLAAAVVAVAACAQRPVQRLARVPLSDEPRLPLRGTAGAHTARAQPLDALPGDTALTSLSLVLKPSAEQEAALDQLLADQANPASAQYGQWLTPEQFGDRFGAAEAELQLLQTWLQTNGFAVQSVARSRNRIVFAGTAAAAERAFRTSLRRYHRADGDFFENSEAVQLPASLLPLVSGVTGLSSFRLQTPQVQRAAPQYTTSTGTHYLVPDDLRTIYGTNTLLGAGYNGSGVKIGIIGQSAVDTQQLTYFQQKTGQTLNLPTMVLVPNTGKSNRLNGDEGESELDLEYAGGNAPGASVQFIYTGCTDTASTSVLDGSKVSCNNNGVFEATIWAVTNNLAPILSLSYGACEEEAASFASSALEPVLRQANAQGQTLTVSSGDAGAASCESSAATSVASAGLAVSYPASSPYVTAVGGTQLTSSSSTYWSNTNNSYLGSALGYVPETSWNDTASYGALASSGGGASQIFAKPTWQVGTGVPADGHRDVPDVAFPASVKQFAYLTCDANGPCTSGAKSFTLTGTARDGGGVGGTSAAAPTFAGMLAVIEQATGGKALGNLNPSLYALAQGSAKGAVFHDITTGNNMVNCTVGKPDCTTGTLGYSAGTGYDLVTGLGSLDIPSLRTALAAYAATTPRIQLAVPGTVTAGTVVTFSATVAGSGTLPTGTVTFTVDGTAVGSAQALASGSASFNYSGFTSTGSHTVAATYSGDTTYSSGAASTVVTVTSVTPTLAITVSPASVTVSSSVTLTATLASAAGAPTGTVTFGGEVASSPVQVVNGVAKYTFAGFATAGLHVVTVAYTPAATGTSAVFSGVQSSVNIVVTATSQMLTPTLQLTLNAGTVVPGQPVGARVTASGTGGTPTGQVLLQVDKDGPTSLATLSGGQLVGSVFSPLTIGTHTLQALYYGDNTYLGATASATFTVAPQSISIGVAPGVLNATYGSSASGNVTVTSGVGAAGQTTFVLSIVSSTGAAFAGCYSLNPRTLTLPANGSAATALTLYTTASSCNSTSTVPLRSSDMRNSTAGLLWSRARYGTLAMLPLPLLLLAGRRRRLPVALLLMLVGLAASLSVLGCGSGTSSPNSGTGTGTTSTGTTASSNAGSYVIRITAATAQPVGSALTASTTFTLNVQ